MLTQGVNGLSLVFKLWGVFLTRHRRSRSRRNGSVGKASARICFLSSYFRWCSCPSLCLQTSSLARLLLVAVAAAVLVQEGEAVEVAVAAQQEEPQAPLAQEGCPSTWLTHPTSSSKLPRSGKFTWSCQLFDYPINAFNYCWFPFTTLGSGVSTNIFRHVI